MYECDCGRKYESMEGLDACQIAGHWYLTRSTPVDDLIEACRMLIEQYNAVDEYQLGGALTNSPFLDIEAALKKIGK